MPSFWMLFADGDEQGSFCDAESQVHYDNHSKSEAEDAQEVAMRNGDHVVSPNGREPYDMPASQRWNTTRMSADNQGAEYPTREKPGE